MALTYPSSRGVIVGVSHSRGMNLRGPMSPADRTQILIPRPLSLAERTEVREHFLRELSRLRRLLDAAEGALDGPDPESALVVLGFLVARASGLLFPL